MKELANTLLNLPESIRTPFTLFYRGASKEAIAEELGLPIDEVTDRISQARQEIKNTISLDYTNISLTKVA